MTDKIDYINASIEILEKREELNHDELAGLCNLKKFVYQTQPTFKVGEYYHYKSMENVLHILKITAVMDDGVDFKFLNTKSGVLATMKDIKLDKKDVEPATDKQIEIFICAELKEEAQ